jgi:hypothetical protein
MVPINVGKFSNLDKLSSQLSKSEVQSFLGTIIGIESRNELFFQN